jgi:23S rRNA G2069 N7-methylase RlmK/C1962 C5-methylase RlmI
LNSIDLNRMYTVKKDIFHKYISNIKKKSKWDIFTIINPTFIKNPYASRFSEKLFY